MLGSSAHFRRDVLAMVVVAAVSCIAVLALLAGLAWACAWVLTHLD